MAAIKLILKIDGPHVINDLGLTIEGAIGDAYDLIDERAEDVSTSVDLIAAVTAGAFVVLDPRDVNEVIELSLADSITVLENHNQVHWGVVGGRFGDLDNPNNEVPVDSVVILGPNGADAVARPLSTVLGGEDNVEVIQDIIGDMLASENDITYDDDTGTLELEDNFLRNDGDVLDSGTLSVASGAAIDIESGGSLTIQDAPVNPTDAANKEYVDALANGMDHKESVRVATTEDFGFAQYTDNGGVGDTLAGGGQFIVDEIALEDGDRVLVKDQNDSTQNGIYVYDAAAFILTRAEDQDGSASNEVSAGNTTFVELGDRNGSTSWIVTGDGELTVNTDDINWTQNSGQGTYSGVSGVSLNGTEFSVTTTNVSPLVGDVELADELIIGDSSNALNTVKTTFSDVLADLDIVNGITEDGFTVRTAEGTYVSRAIEVQPAGELGGLVIDAGDGVAGNPILGLDIKNTAVFDGGDLTDLIMAFDQSAGENRVYSLDDVKNLVIANTNRLWSPAGNSTGDPFVVLTGTEEINISGGAGITVDFNGSTDTVEYSITGNGISNAAAVDGDAEIVIFDPATGTPTKTSLDDMVDALDIVTSVAPSTDAGLEGIAIDSTDSAVPVVGLDIDNLTAAADELAETNELAVFDGTSNVSMTGRQVADGVATMLGLPELTLSDINGQQVVTVPDATRGDKELSLDSNQLQWSEATLTNNDWIQIGGASDGDSGYIMPLNGTIVMVTAHCENAENATDINIYNGASTTAVATAGSFTASANAQFVNTTLDVDFAQGDRIRLRNVGGTIRDTVVSMHIKWRA